MLSINIRGFGVKGKFGWVKNICFKERPDIIAIQETKCRFLGDGWFHNLLGNDNCGFVQKEASGNSGGMLLVWDTNSFVVESAVKSDYYLAIRGKWCGSGHESIIVNVYGPHSDVKKQEMWFALDSLLRSIDSAWVVCGDFNEVRNQSDRLSCDFHQCRATRFNDFITMNNLIEIPINGKRFTRISDDGTKFSKLDRFFVDDKYISHWNDLSVVALERRESDHCPLMLRDKIVDFGPKPFKIFDEWFKKEGVDQVIHDSWAKSVDSWKKGLFISRLAKKCEK
ncbi:uncharacterized protein [Rutidosis leptorrhynchoides]|uniref:uncharacterized protein n=1 Tax=Rutidosis leptorrhynchoides TaxID=125765 RepID=UPI003A9A5BC6